MNKLEEKIRLIVYENNVENTVCKIYDLIESEKIEQAKESYTRGYIDSYKDIEQAKKKSI